MAQLAEHQTVKQFREREAAGYKPVRLQTLDTAWLRQLCVEAAWENMKEMIFRMTQAEMLA